MDGTFPWSNMKQLAAIGALGMSVLEAHGGLGLSILDAALVLEEIARDCYAPAPVFRPSSATSLRLAR